MSNLKKPLILITNDDGIRAPGIKALSNSLEPYFRVCVVAPETEQSGVGMSITYRKPVSYDIHPWSEGHEAYSVTGTPADCIRIALSVILKETPALIVSGINQGSNLGRTVLYSGTVAGVIEATLRGLPGIAFSCDSFTNPNYKAAVPYIPKIVTYALKHIPPKGTFFNVTFPDHVDIRGIRLARQGSGYWMEAPEKRLNPDGAPYYWMGGKWTDYLEHVESDVSYVKEGFISIAPIHVGEMTDHSFLVERRADFESFFSVPDEESARRV